MPVLILAILLILLPISASADVVGVSGVWTSPPNPSATLQTFNFNGPNFSGFSGNEFGIRPTNVSITAGTAVGFLGMINAGDFGSITMNGRTYPMRSFDCSLHIGSVPCAGESVTMAGSALVPFITNPFAESFTLTFPVVVNGSYFGCCLDRSVCDSVNFHGEVAARNVDSNNTPCPRAF